MDKEIMVQKVMPIRMEILMVILQILQVKEDHLRDILG